MIQNIWCIGRNYAEHAQELGNPVPTEIMVFLKAGSTASIDQPQLKIPSWCSELHHEIEVALELDHSLQVSHAYLSLDLTDRERQNKLKKQGHPWTLAKSFKGATALACKTPVQKIAELNNLQLQLWVNGELRQKGNTRDMIFSYEQIIAFVKEHFPVVPGDIILTGTPPGVGPFKRGDTLKAEIENLGSHTWQVV